MSEKTNPKTITDALYLSYREGMYRVSLSGNREGWYVPLAEYERVCAQLAAAEAAHPHAARLAEVERAVRAEREACAGLVEAVAGDVVDETDASKWGRELLRLTAAAIRARGEKGGGA